MPRSAASVRGIYSLMVTRNRPVFSTPRYRMPSPSILCISPTVYRPANSVPTGRLPAGLRPASTPPQCGHTDTRLSSSPMQYGQMRFASMCATSFLRGLFQIIVPYLPPPRNPQRKKAPPSDFFHRGQHSIRTNISSRTSIHQTHRSTVPQCSLNGFPEHLQLRSMFWQESSSYCWPRYSLPLP